MAAVLTFKPSKKAAAASDRRLGRTSMAAPAARPAPIDRVSKLHSDPAVASLLVEKGGYASALQIANTAPAQFVQMMAPHLSGNIDAAEQIHARATQVRSSVLHALANVRTAVQSRQFNALKGANVGADMQKQFAALPGYADMFGTLNYCECDECRSIFGPAAYLVDLMRIIDTYVTTPNATTIADDLKFDARRGDIGRIALTCANTNDTFPQLCIVNERLSALAARNVEPTASLDVFENIARLTYPFSLPFHLPLTRIGLDLARLGTSLDEIYRTLAVPAGDLARATLGLSRGQSAFITTTLADKPALLAVSYGVADTALSGLADVQALLDATGLTVSALQELLHQDLSDAEIGNGVQKNFYINRPGGKILTYAAGDGKTPPRIANLDNAALDRISRFVRLAAQLGWGYAQLDWALRIANGGNAPDISDATLQTLADMIDLSRQSGLDVATVCRLVGQVKTYGAGTG